MESLQAMKLSKLSDASMYSSSPPKPTQQIPIPVKERISSTKHKPSKLVEVNTK